MNVRGIKKAISESQAVIMEYFRSLDKKFLMDDRSIIDEDDHYEHEKRELYKKFILDLRGKYYIVTGTLSIEAKPISADRIEYVKDPDFEIIKR